MSATARSTAAVELIVLTHVAYLWHDSRPAKYDRQRATPPRRSRMRSGITDAALIDEALEAFLVRHRSAEVDASYAAYDEHPVDEPDEWGDLASFRQAAAAT